MTVSGFTNFCDPPYYTSTADLPADYCIGNFDIKGHVLSFERTRANVFLVGETQSFRLYGGPWTGATYEVRDYYGTVVQSGSAAVATLTLSPALPPGWYRLYLHRATGVSPWGTAMGGACFAVWRSTSGFHAMKQLTDPLQAYSADGADPYYAGGNMLFGLRRLTIYDAANPTLNRSATTSPEWNLSGVQADILVEKDWYLPFDTTRDKQIVVAFPYYNNLTGENAGVTAVVNATEADVRYYEAHNEPNAQGAATWLPKQQAFYNAVKAADATAKVIGPCPVEIAGPSSSGSFAFLDDFFALGGADYIDELSFHDYNSHWGDLILGRQVYDRLDTLLAKHGIRDIPKWMTEWGAGYTNNGVYQPHLGARMVMLALQLWEQYGIPKERISYFYDDNHGFYSVPTWWKQWEITFHPLAALARVWSEELMGKHFARRYGFGNVADNWTIGSRFDAADGSSVAVFSSCGRTDQQLTLNVTGAASVVVVTPFGVESTVAVVSNQITVTLRNGIPTYVRLPVGAKLYPVAEQYGPNLALNKTFIPAGSGAGASKVTDGVLRSWYLTQTGDALYGNDACFTDDNTTFPQYHRLDFGTPTTVDTSVVMCPPPYSFNGSLVDFDLEFFNGDAWQHLATITEDPMTLVEPTDQNLTACQVESFWSERCVFVQTFSPITTTGLRLLVRDASRGGYPDQLTYDVRGEVNTHAVQIRAWQAYNRSASVPVAKYVAA